MKIFEIVTTKKLPVAQESATAGGTGTGAGSVATSMNNGNGFGISIFYKQQDKKARKKK
jgi:uncharacterized protein HemX